jgi:hypothetical protein
MTDKQDPLVDLWQQQQVILPDLAAIQKQWHKVQWQQRLYYSLDIISCLMVIGLFFWSYDKFQWFGKIWMGAIVFGVLILTLYLGWLRRHALRLVDSCTDDYLHKLRLQLSNNVKIARITKASIWAISLATLIYYFGTWAFELIPPDKWLRKAKFSLIFFAFFIPPMWYWANKREQKFKREIKELDNMSEQQSHTRPLT